MWPNSSVYTVCSCSFMGVGGQQGEGLKTKNAL